MLNIIQKNLKPTQKLNDLIKLSEGVSFAIHCPIAPKYDLNVPIFSMEGLWHTYNNVVLYSSFSDFYWLENLKTNHKSIFFIYDLDWHITGLSYKNVIKSLHYPDILLCRNKDHAKKIEEYCGRKPLVLSEINFKEVINGLTKEN